MQTIPPPIIVSLPTNSTGKKVPYPSVIVKPVNTACEVSPFANVTTLSVILSVCPLLALFGDCDDGGDGDLMIVVATISGSSGSVLVRVMFRPLKFIFSRYVPGLTITVSPSLQSSIAAWIVAYSSGTRCVAVNAGDCVHKIDIKLSRIIFFIFRPLSKGY